MRYRKCQSKLWTCEYECDAMRSNCGLCVFSRFLNSEIESTRKTVISLSTHEWEFCRLFSGNSSSNWRHTATCNKKNEIKEKFVCWSSLVANFRYFVGKLGHLIASKMIPMMSGIVGISMFGIWFFVNCRIVRYEIGILMEMCVLKLELEHRMESNLCRHRRLQPKRHIRSTSIATV